MRVLAGPGESPIIWVNGLKGTCCAIGRNAVLVSKTKRNPFVSRSRNKHVEISNAKLEIITRLTLWITVNIISHRIIRFKLSSGIIRFVVYRSCVFFINPSRQHTSYSSYYIYSLNLSL